MNHEDPRERKATPDRRRGKESLAHLSGAALEILRKIERGFLRSGPAHTAGHCHSVPFVGNRGIHRACTRRHAAGSIGLICEAAALRAGLRQLHEHMLRGASLPIELVDNDRAIHPSVQSGERLVKVEDGSEIRYAWTSQFIESTCVIESSSIYELHCGSAPDPAPARAGRPDPATSPA